MINIYLTSQSPDGDWLIKIFQLNPIPEWEQELVKNLKNHTKLDPEWVMTSKKIFDFCIYDDYEPPLIDLYLSYKIPFQFIENFDKINMEDTYQVGAISCQN